jgi:serine protease
MECPVWFINYTIRSHSNGKYHSLGPNVNNITGGANSSKFSFHIGKVRREDDGDFSMADVMVAAQDCVFAGAKVISLGFSCRNDTSNRGCYKRQWDRQFRDIYNQGILIIGAAGNSGKIHDEYPGAYKAVMSVSAVNQNGLWFEESTRNNQTEIAAPGV